MTKPKFLSAGLIIISEFCLSRKSVVRIYMYSCDGFEGFLRMALIPDVRIEAMYCVRISEYAVCGGNHCVGNFGKN